jgi:gamma-tubulin complex component 5
MNEWTDTLATSLLPADLAPSKSRRLKAQFARGIRHHNFGRTNQFEVEERLIGLEEKFQVLNYDDLSDDLRQQRIELLQHQQQWVPDVLDFLLRMSMHPMSGDDPINDADEVDLTEAPLTWADIERDDPIDRRDRMWRQPEYSDLSSDDDPIVSSPATTPESTKARYKRHRADDPQPVWTTPQSQALGKLVMPLSGPDESRRVQNLSEIHIIRETLFMLQGLPARLFSSESGILKRRADMDGSVISERSLDSMLSRAVTIAEDAALVRGWTFPGQRLPHINALEDSFSSVIESFDSFLALCQEGALRARHQGGVCSLLHTLEAVHEHATPILTVANFISAVYSRNELALLDVLFEHTIKLEQIGAFTAFKTMSQALLRSMTVFMAPIMSWIACGTIEDGTSQHSVTRVPDQQDKSRLWHGWFSPINQDHGLPALMEPFASRIFVAGKTAAFAGALRPAKSSEIPEIDFTKFFPGDAHISLLPFASSLLAGIEDCVNMHLESNTERLKISLEQDCKLPLTLSALSHIYLAGAPYVTSVLDAELFRRLDRAAPSWNDRFVVCDLIEEACQHLGTIDMGRISVQSEEIPRSRLLRERRSVKVLESLAIDYTLPWPIANILSTNSIASYRRVALLLLQIRRARYVLERHGFINLRKAAKPRKLAEAIYSNLIVFINILEAHLMHCVVQPLTEAMHTRLKGTVDEMIAIHKSYTDALERSCLLAKNLKVVRETLMQMLDLCLDFGFSIADPKDSGNDFALSKTRTQFRKLMNLFVAGLRGAARADTGSGTNGGDGGTNIGAHVGESLELLADSLDSARFKM